MKFLKGIDLDGKRGRQFAAPVDPDDAANRAWVLDQLSDLGGGTVTDVTGAAPVTSSGGLTPQIGIDAATTEARGTMSAADKAKLDGVAAGATANTGTVTGVTGTAPILSTGGAAPAISISPATTVVAGSMSAADKAKLDGVETAATADQTPAEILTALKTVDADDSGLNANTLQGLTAAQVQNAVTAAIIDGSPGTLDTLNELAAALGDDPNFAATVTAALDARMRRAAQTIGDGVASDIVVAHNLGTRDVHVAMYETAAPYAEVITDWDRTSTSAITVHFEGPPAAGEYRVVVMG